MNTHRTSIEQRVRRSGAAMVELALVLPIFFTVVLGIIEFGRAMMVGQLVTNAAREAARLAVIDGSSNSDVETYVNDFLEASANVESADVNVAITITPGPDNPGSPTDVANAASRDLITIRVEVPFSKVSYITGDYLEDKTLVGQSAMRHE